MLVVMMMVMGSRSRRHNMLRVTCTRLTNTWWGIGRGLCLLVVHDYVGVDVGEVDSANIVHIVVLHGT